MGRWHCHVDYNFTSTHQSSWPQVESYVNSLRSQACPLLAAALADAGAWRVISARASLPPAWSTCLWTSQSNHCCFLNKNRTERLSSLQVAISAAQDTNWCNLSNSRSKTEKLNSSLWVAGLVALLLLLTQATSIWYKARWDGLALTVINGNTFDPMLVENLTNSVFKLQYFG